MIVLPDEPVLRRLGLRLQRGVIPEASSAGSRRGPRLGSSREFIGLRAYQFGDDLRDLDRAATLRFNRAHIRQYRQEVEASLVLLLDASSSMAFGDPSKFEYGQALAAALGGLALAHHDRVGAAVFGETLSASLPAGRGHGQWRARNSRAHVSVSCWGWSSNGGSEASSWTWSTTTSSSRPRANVMVP